MTVLPLFPDLAGRIISRTWGKLGPSFGAIFQPSARESALINGDSAKVLAGLPDGVFQTCVTSPPYWSLRDYNIDGQIGMEASLEEYLDSLVVVFEQVRRVMRDDGTLWLNVGDSYTSGGRAWRAPDRRLLAFRSDRAPFHPISNLAKSPLPLPPAAQAS